MLQIIHDVAPGAALAFATAYGGQANFAANITALRQTAGADIIVDDILYFNEPMFQDGVIAQAIDEVVAGGAAYFSAAGNFARQSYTNGYNAHTTAIGIRGGTLHDFGSGDSFQQVTVPVGGLLTISFQWDEPFFSAGGTGAASNYDFLVYGNDAATNLPLNSNNLIGGQDQTNIGGDALEIVQFLNDGSFDVDGNLVPDTVFNFAFEHVAGPPAGQMKYVYNFGLVPGFGGSFAINQFATNSSTLIGHANATGAIAVGAAAYFNTPEFDTAGAYEPPTLEAFSALGGTNILFDTAGNRLAQPEVRTGVDVVGPDGVNTTFFGNADPVGTGAYEADGLPNFFGTSAAAPHVAGLAALLLQADPLLAPAGIQWALQESAIDMDNPYTTGFDTGYDAASGYGFVDALGALGLVQDSPELVELDPNEYIIVNDTRDLLDAVPGGVIDVDAVMPGNQVSLRAAIIAANGGGPATTLLVQGNTYALTRNGYDSSALNGDLDIAGDVTIVGTGAGLSIIDASGLTTPDRVFEVASTARLDLSRVTVTGGNAPTTGGGGILVAGELVLSDAAVVGNTTAASGGGLLNTGQTTITNSVFTDNSATNPSTSFGGAILSSGSTSLLAIGSSIFAKNTAPANHFPNVRVNHSPPNVGDWINLGNSLVDDERNNDFFDADLGDVIYNPTTKLVDYVVTSMKDGNDTTPELSAMSLREASMLANGASGADVIWLPAWRHRLELSGAEPSADATVNDLDIVGELEIVGTGAGLSIIDVGGLEDSPSQSNNRAFQISGSTSELDISRVTLTGSRSTANPAGMLALVDAGGTLVLTDSAVVNNVAGVNGVSIRGINAHVTVRRSVFTNNESTDYNAAAIFVVGSSGSPASLTIGDSIFALNRAPLATETTNVWVGANTVITNEGYNLVDDDRGGFFDAHAAITDHIGTPDYVATSVADHYNRANDSYSRSVRDAIDAANLDDNSFEEIWLPAWNYVLTRERDLTPGSTDVSVRLGDLDITDSLKIRGIAAKTQVDWAPGLAVDAVFDLLGDYNGDGIANGHDNGEVGAEDFTIWQNTRGSTTDLRADGDDDGIVDDDDYLVWNSNFGNVLELCNVS